MYTNVEAQEQFQGEKERYIPQNEDQKRFWTAQYCDIDYKDKPQNDPTIMSLCDTAMQYLSFFCVNSALANIEHESCDYLNGVVQIVSKYTDARNIFTIDELVYDMPKAEALNYQKPTETDFENAYQQLYSIDAGKSKFELMINPDKPLIERGKPLIESEQLPTLGPLEDKEQDDDSDNDNDDEEEDNN